MKNLTRSLLSLTRWSLAWHPGASAVDMVENLNSWASQQGKRPKGSVEFLNRNDGKSASCGWKAQKA